MVNSVLPTTIDETLDLMNQGGYIAEKSLATALFLSLSLGRPLLLEGEAGVGKTEIAKVLSDVLSRKLIRLQCYEGLDASSALYEWNYPRQMMEIRLAETEKSLKKSELETQLFSDKFLIKRPLLEALQTYDGCAPVLLIDELDRTDEAFEAFLLEILSDFQVTVPELGTVKAKERPIVIITSNRTREIHDAIKRRCFYHWVDYPDMERELQILAKKAPNAPEFLSQQIVAFINKLRNLDLFKLPGVAETIDWAHALTQLDRLSLDPDTINDTMGTLLKYQDDIAQIKGSEAAQILKEVEVDLKTTSL